MLGRIGGPSDSKKIRDVMMMNYTEGLKSLKEIKIINDDILKQPNDNKTKISAEKLEGDINRELEKYNNFDNKCKVAFKRYPQPVIDEEVQK